MKKLLIDIPEDNTLQERVAKLESDQHGLIDAIMKMSDASEEVKAPLRLRYQMVTEELNNTRDMLHTANTNQQLRETIMADARRVIYTASDWAVNELNFEQKRALFTLLGLQVRIFKNQSRQTRTELAFTASVSVPDGIPIKLTFR